MDEKKQEERANKIYDLIMELADDNAKKSYKMTAGEYFKIVAMRDILNNIINN